MEHSNQTPLLHQSVNVDVVHTSELSSDDETVQNLAQFLDEFNDQATEFAPAGAESGPVQGPSMNELSEVPIDDLAAADHDSDRIVREQSAQPLVLRRRGRSRLYSQFVPPRNPNEPCLRIRMEIVIGIAFLTAYWAIACTVLVYGLNEVGIMRVGVGCSLLLQPNRYFVESINVEQSSHAKVGPILYGFNKEPLLDVISTWSYTHYASLQANIYRDWIYVLNEGSEINISYSVPSSSSLLLTITKGSNNYGQWFYDQSFPDTALSWNIIHGNGLIQQNILHSGTYQISMGNLNSHVVKVQLNITARAFVYNTSQAHYMCMLAQGQCGIPVLFTEENHVVLTTPHLQQGISDGEWHVKLTYEPRWSVYFGGIVLISVIILVHICLFNKFVRICGRMVRWASSRSLLPCTVHDLLSSDSSDESICEDVDDYEAETAPSDGESSTNMQHRCVICFNTPRDCFFLPCGHFVACFVCGVRIASTPGTCPICRKRVKKVKNIYTS